MINKIYNIENLSKIISKFQRKSKTIVLCHGVFDLLHVGHIKHLKMAKEYGDKLVVTITADEFVNKGPGKPIFNQKLRAEAIASLEMVDFVAINSSSTAVNPIKYIKPNIYCKGKDYKNYNLDTTNQIKKEASAIKSVGGRIIHTITELFSSSKIINQTNLNLSNEQKTFINKIKKK